MLPVDDDDCETEELLWVKAGEPGDKPTIIRQIRSESSTSSSSRDNSGGSGIQRKNLLTIEKGTVYRTAGQQSTDSIIGLDETMGLQTSSNESRVIVVTINEQVYPASVDRTKIQKWKELHSPGIHKKEKHFRETISGLETKRPISQPSTHEVGKFSPNIKRCASADPAATPSSCCIKTVKSREQIKSRDEGYTSLTEDCKDLESDCTRSKSLPNAWTPLYLDRNPCELNLHKYAARLTNNNGDQIDFTSILNSNEKQLIDTVETDNKNEKHSKSRYRVESLIESCTCFVCLRSVIYHTQDEDDTDSLVDHPCSCSDCPSTKCCSRWSMIGAMTCFLPFLIFYPPLKLCMCLHDYRKKRKFKTKEKQKEKKLLKEKEDV